MITVKEKFPQLTSEEYFAWEEQQLEKHEYFDGEIFAMSGGSKNHSLIAVGLTSLFFNHLRGSGCETGNSDLKIKAVDSHKYTYPDVVVTCDERDKGNSQSITYPCLVVEVLSKGTEAYDRGESLGYIKKIRFFGIIYWFVQPVLKSICITKKIQVNGLLKAIKWVILSS